LVGCGPSLTESSDNESERSRKFHKRPKTSPVTSGDGTKPAIAITDPLFASIYKEALKELKYQLSLVDPFPNVVRHDSLPRRVYNYGINATIESGTFEEAEVRSHAMTAFDREWLSSVC
jgi:hypothetical protein